jgi:cytochrome P450 family 26 subfamily A
MNKVKGLWFSMPRQARQVFMAFFGPNGLQSFVPKMHKTTIAHFAQFWEGKDEIMAGNSNKHFTFSIAIDLFMSIKEGPDFYSFQRHMKTYSTGLSQLPLNFPGTLYRKAIISRENMLGILDKMICCRRKVRNFYFFSFKLLNKILNSFMQQVRFQTKLELFANSSFI